MVQEPQTDSEEMLIDERVKWLCRNLGEGLLESIEDEDFD